MRDRTIFFDWKRICRRCKYDPYKIIDTITSYAKKSVPADLAGNSFLLNVKGLYESKYFDSEKFNYIQLAAIRNYFDYAYQDEKGLWIPLLANSIDIVKIKQNRLLHITQNNYLKFKYEEMK